LVKNGNIVVNLSNTTIYLSEMAILNKGLHFCITNKNISKSLGQYRKEIVRFIRTIQIKNIFRDSDEGEILKFTRNPDWNPPMDKCNTFIAGYKQYLNKKIKK